MGGCSISPCDVQPAAESATVTSDTGPGVSISAARTVNQVRLRVALLSAPHTPASTRPSRPPLSRSHISEVAASPGRTGDHLVSDLIPGVPGEPTRSSRARLCRSRIGPEPSRALAMEMMEGDVMDKLEDMSSVYDFDPITGNIPATKVEITVSCR